MYSSGSLHVQSLLIQFALEWISTLQIQPNRKYSRSSTSSSSPYSWPKWSSKWSVLVRRCMWEITTTSLIALSVSQISQWSNFPPLVCLSVVDIIVTYSVASSSSGKGVLSAFRAFRLLRIFKLAKSWKKLQSLLKTIMQSLRDISSFSVLVLLLIFVYVMIGLELFAN